MPKKLITAKSKSLGVLESWNKDPHGFHGVTSHGKFSVLLYNDHIARIRATLDEEFEDFSYAVVTEPDSNTTPAIAEFQDTLEIKTAAFVLRVSKSPVRFSFYAHDGTPISEDDHAFGTSWNGQQVTTYKKLQEGERFIGLGEKTGPLDRKGQGYQNWNTDNFGYSTSADPLYCTIPFYMGVHHGLSYGIFFDNSHKSFFNFGASNNRFSSFSADAGEMNYYFIHDKSVSGIIKQYTHLTGRMELPPLWSLGYQQCRYSYYPDKEVLNLARTFREKDLPADTIVLDIHYMDQYKIFTWNKRDFSEPKLLLQQLQEMGFHVVVMCDPGIKVEEGYKAYDEGIKHNTFIQYQDGTNYTGQVWPGWCHFPDFSNPKTRDWWREQFKDYVNLGVEGYWNDMNEIATWGQMIPENIEMDFEGNKSTMRRGRNVYGLLMARSTYEAAKSLMKGKRPFNLTRSGYAGVQRYAAVWTGDNVAYDEHMLLGVRMVNSMGLSGIAFAGYDVGGFVGDANSKLFARWISLGAFSPFFRGHSMINSRDSEPWAYGEEVEQISRNYIKFRYQIMPYLYSLFYDASETGMPIQRSLAIDYTHDWKVYEGQFHNQYMFGPSILVAPAESTKDFVKVYLPEGDWYSLYNGQKYPGNSEIIVECPVHRLPVFVKGGALIPMQGVVAHTKQKNDTLVLHVYQGKENSSFTFYEDDGSTFQYQQKAYAKRLVEYFPADRKLIIGDTEGSFVSGLKKLKIILHGVDHPVSSSLNDTPVHFTPEANQFFNSLEKFDPFFDPEAAPQEDVIALMTDYTSDKIVIHL